MNGTDRQPFGAPWTWRRLVWSLLFVFLLLAVFRCGAENAAQLQQYGHPRDHHPVVTQ